MERGAKPDVPEGRPYGFPGLSITLHIASVLSIPPSLPIPQRDSFSRCRTLCYTRFMNSINVIERLKRAGLGDALLTALDVIEPISAIGAQVLYITQPMTRLLGDQRSETTALAQLLETPEGIRTLRQMLETDEDIQQEDKPG